MSVFDREKMIRLVQDAVDGCSRSFAALIVDYLMKHGVGFCGNYIETLGLSLRTYHILKRAGINTVEDLRKWDEADLAKLRGAGVSVLEEIRRVLQGG